MKFHRLMCCLLCTIISCTDGKNDTSATANQSEIADTTDSPPKNATIDSVPRNIQVDSVIHVAFEKDSISVTLKGHLDKTGDPVICYLPVTTGKKLNAAVVAEKQKAVVRFSHIELPGGNSDGPFGSNLKYDLKKSGVYKLYIAPNKMAGDPVSTDFTLQITVQ